MELRYFKVSDFDCRETGENDMDEYFLRVLDELRDRCGFPFNISSGYRSAEHSEERDKERPGTHAQGIAADIKVYNGAQRYAIVREAMEMGFSGIGIAKSFVHVDIRSTRPVLWTY